MMRHVRGFALFLVAAAIGCNRESSNAGESPAKANRGSNADGGAAAEQISPELIEGPRNATMTLGKRLEQALGQSMAEGSPASTISVCNETAPRLAAAVSTPSLTVGRTALKVRNPDNVPDAWERKVLEQFQRKVEGGADPSTLEHAEIVQTDAGKRLRYMKGIGTAGLCLTCHGQDIAPSVAERLQQLYPQDRATGFEAGDLRGAFTVTKQL